MSRIVLTGGGTGGHIYPALAIASGVKRRWPDTEILYIGAKGGMESHVVAETAFHFRGITAAGWQGRKILSLANAVKASIKGRMEAIKLLSAFAPRAVIGTGGFVCLPVAMAAAKKRIPVYIHEQNAYPGLANRLISSWAKQVMISFEEAADRLPLYAKKKAKLTGLPVRETIAGASASEAYSFYQLREGWKTILVAGGSQGAERINRAMLHVIKSLYGQEGVQIIFATGQRDYPQMKEALESAGIGWETSSEAGGNVRMLPYIDRMDLAYAAADVFVGRAGATTLAEITLCRLPAILIPYPFHSDNQQLHNAASIGDKGGAVVIEDKQLTGPVLLNMLRELLDDDNRRMAMAECSYRASHSYALENILDVLAEIMDKE